MTNSILNQTKLVPRANSIAFSNQKTIIRPHFRLDRINSNSIASGFRFNKKTDAKDWEHLWVPQQEWSRTSSTVGTRVFRNKYACSTIVKLTNIASPDSLYVTCKSERAQWSNYIYSGARMLWTPESGVLYLLRSTHKCLAVLEKP